DGDNVKYVACIMLDGALTWWNSYGRTVGIDAANAIPWSEFKLMLINNLMDQVVQDMGEKTTDNKRKWEGNNNNNNNYNQNKRQEVAKVYSAGQTNKGHMARDCRSPARAANQGNQNNQRNIPACYGCGQRGHYLNECPRAGNQGRGNQI
ncbi:putative reverse transcriptase domain-containing protein, partial [Tanacetum coccineum]